MYGRTGRRRSTSGTTRGMFSRNSEAIQTTLALAAGDVVRSSSDTMRRTALTFSGWRCRRVLDTTTASATTRSTLERGVCHRGVCNRGVCHKGASVTD